MDRELKKVAADVALNSGAMNELSAAAEKQFSTIPLEVRPKQTEEKAVAADIAERLITQDPPLKSKRTWAFGLGALTAVLAVPEVQELIALVLGPQAAGIVPVLTAALTAVLAKLSKQADVRPLKIKQG